MGSGIADLREDIVSSFPVVAALTAVLAHRSRCKDAHRCKDTDLCKDVQRCEYIHIGRHLAELNEDVAENSIWR